ncbi:MAG: hypothetical protein HRT54_18960 [Colwellia sp.]|nr:hypothetical protein [Colwellia sp.]
MKLKLKLTQYQSIQKSAPNKPLNVVYINADDSDEVAFERKQVLADYEMNLFEIFILLTDKGVKVDIILIQAGMENYRAVILLTKQVSFTEKWIIRQGVNKSMVVKMNLLYYCPEVNFLKISAKLAEKSQ